MRRAVFALLLWLLLLPLCWCSTREQYNDQTMFHWNDCENEGDKGLHDEEINEITNEKCNATWIPKSSSISDSTYYGLKGFVRAVTEKCLETRTNLSILRLTNRSDSVEVLETNKAAHECALNTIARRGCQPETQDNGHKEHPLYYICNYYGKFTEVFAGHDDCLEFTNKCVARYKKAPQNKTDLLPSCENDNTKKYDTFVCTYSKESNMTEQDWKVRVVNHIFNYCSNSSTKTWTREEGICMFNTLYKNCPVDEGYVFRQCVTITGHADFCPEFIDSCNSTMKGSMQAHVTTTIVPTTTTTISTTTKPTEAPTTDTTTGEILTTSATDPLTSPTSTKGSDPDTSPTETTPSTTVKEESTTITETTDAPATGPSGEHVDIPGPTTPEILTTITEAPTSTSTEVPSSTSPETTTSSASTEAPTISSTTEASTTLETSTMLTSTIAPDPPVPPKVNTRAPVEEKIRPTTTPADDGEEEGLKKQPRAEANQKPAEEEEGPNLVGLWVVLAIVVVIGAIVGIVVGVVLKRRQKKKKEQAEALKSNASSKKNIGGELGFSGRPAAALPGSTAKGPARKPPAKKSPAAKEMKQMEAGVIDKGFKSLGPLTVDVAIRKGQKIAHATGDDDGREIDKVIFDHGLNNVVDIGSNIEKVSTEELATVTVDRTDNTVEGPSRKGRSKERIEKVVVDTKATEKSSKRTDSSARGK